jgi:hypothetical protein
LISGSSRGGERLAFERAEQRERVLAEGLAKPALDLVERTRRDFVLQLLERFDVGRRQKGAEHREHLSHLDEHAAQARETGRQTPRVPDVHALHVPRAALSAEQSRNHPVCAVRRNDGPEQQQGAKRAEHGAPSLAGDVRRGAAAGNPVIPRPCRREGGLWRLP